MPEAAIDLLTGTLHSNYTHPLGTAVLDVVSGVMPDPGDTWTIRLNNGAFYTVSGFTGTGPYTATLSALEYGTDSDCTTGQAWSAVTSKRALQALISQSAPKDLISAESRAAAGGTMNPAFFKNKTLTSGSTQTILDISSGPGYLSDFWLAIANLPGGNDPDINIKLTVDGDVVFDGYHMMFFAVYFWGVIGSSFSNDFVQNWGGQSIRIPIPFTSSIKIELKNNYGSSINLWWTLGYVTGVENNWPRCKHLQIKSGTASGLAQDAVGTLINETGLGKGRFFGMYLCWAGDSASNHNFLEGEIAITIDGVLAYQSSGAEDFYAMSGFFGSVVEGQGNRFQTLTLKIASPPIYAAMRFHAGEPMNFEDALKIEVAAGQSSSGNTFTGTVDIWYTIWYYLDA